MKKLSIIFCSLILGLGSLSAQAPSYTDFEWDIFGLGIAMPVGEDQISRGIAMGGEVRFNATDYLSVGIGSDFSFFDIKEFENIEDEDITIGFSSTAFISGDYYFNTTSSKRAFAGLALGSTDIGDIEFTEEGDEATIIEGPTGMSIAPRVGFEYSHARFLLHYNIGLKEELTDYIAVKVSLTLWGGYQGNNN